MLFAPVGMRDGLVNPRDEKETARVRARDLARFAEDQIQQTLMIPLRGERDADGVEFFELGASLLRRLLGSVQLEPGFEVARRISELAPELFFARGPDDIGHVRVLGRLGQDGWRDGSEASYPGSDRDCVLGIDGVIDDENARCFWELVDALNGEVPIDLGEVPIDLGVASLGEPLRFLRPNKNRAHQICTEPSLRMIGGSAFMLSTQRPRVKSPANVVQFHSIEFSSKQKRRHVRRKQMAPERGGAYIILLMMRLLCSVVRPGVWCARGPASSTGSWSLSAGTSLS